MTKTEYLFCNLAVMSQSKHPRVFEEKVKIKSYHDASLSFVHEMYFRAKLNRLNLCRYVNLCCLRKLVGQGLLSEEVAIGSLFLYKLFAYFLS